MIKNLEKFDYVEYISENIGKSINYSEYIAGNIDKSVNYAEYLAENLGKSKRQLLKENRIAKLNKLNVKHEGY